MFLVGPALQCTKRSYKIWVSMTIEREAVILVRWNAMEVEWVRGHASTDHDTILRGRIISNLRSRVCWVPSAF